MSAVPKNDGANIRTFLIINGTAAGIYDLRQLQMGRCAELDIRARLRAPLLPGDISRSVLLQVEAVLQVAHFGKNCQVLHKTTRHWCLFSLKIWAF